MSDNITEEFNMEIEEDNTRKLRHVFVISCNIV